MTPRSEPSSADFSVEASMATAIRMLAMDAVQKANSGHPGMPMGMADVATVLFNRFIRIDPRTPGWPDRDRFVLSAGHGSMLQYAIHHLLGYEDMTREALENFRQLGSVTAGHPEYGHTLGVETTTGPLGQGLATAVGMALAERMMAARFGKRLVDHRTFVIAGDGCLQEGISHEAIDLAGHLVLGRLIVLWDDNAISIDGAISLSSSMNQQARFRAAGWHVQSIDGHDREAVAAAIERAVRNRKPSLIACRTRIGRGAPRLEGSHKTHGAPLGAEEIAAARVALDWPHAPFEIPDAVWSAWRVISERGAREHSEWSSRHARHPKSKAFDRFLDQGVPEALGEALAEFRKEHIEKATRCATRKSSQLVLERVNTVLDRTIGGSADLTGSNLTQTVGMASLCKGRYSGRYIHYGIREHAMGALMNGLSLHGGFIPYGGTFLVFSDYARGAIRLSALTGQGVIYVLTHDSIGLGEDGPTHQPVEHLAILRATPNLTVYRPCDIIETAECWELALKDRKTPSVLALSRQDLPMLRQADTGKNRAARGAYVLREVPGRRDLTLVATGSEVEIAVATAERLASERGVRAAVVSMPSFERFEQQSDAYRKAVLGTAPRIAIEAAGRFGWDRYIGPKGRFVGMEGFGASAPAERLYAHFGITVADVVALAADLV